MPIIAVEEDYDQVNLLLSNVPDVKSSATISIETHMSISVGDCYQAEKNAESLKEESGDTSCGLHNSISNKSNELLSDRNRYNDSDLVTNVENVIANHDGDDGVNSLGSTFELCSISSYADPLSLSISRRSIDRSIGNTTSSRNKYVMIRKTSTSQLNKSIGGSTSSNRKVGSSSMNQSTHSTASKLAEVIVVPKTESIDKKYFVDYSREIGRGTKTIVRKCVERSTGNRYAVKSVRRADVNEYEHMRTEANLLTALNHSSIIQIYDTYEDDKYLHMVVEICKGGELYDYVVKPKNKMNGNKMRNNPSEEVAAVIVRKVVDAVAYLHDHNIVHRDLKLENLLFKTNPNNKNRKSLTDIRVIDFGLSRRYNTHHRFASLKKLTSFVGTKFYVAPEVLNHSYTHAADCWSIGVLAYALLSTKAPFTGRNDQELFDKIQSCGEELKFPSPDFDNVSELAKNFIRQLLVADEASRPTASELLDHPWIIKAAGWRHEIEASAGEKYDKPSVIRNFFGRFTKSKKMKVASSGTGNNQDVSGITQIFGDHSH